MGRAERLRQSAGTDARPARRGLDRRTPRATPWLSTLAALAAAVAGCSANPATGERQLNFYSEAQEIAIGREADAEITAQLGVVEDPALQQWVAGIGRSLATRSERPGLPWSFRVVDDPVVNAFALPGGYIYVTRGILAHLESEAELAAVLGHEIGHVTAQHGVQQMSKAQLATGGLLVGAILAPEAAESAGRLAQTGLGLLFLKHGREDERQADDLGLRYMVHGGFEAREMPRVFDVLRRVGESSGSGRVPNWLSSHPDPGDRRERSSRLIAERGYPAGEVRAEDYLRRLDGLAFGADPRDGYFDAGSFFHPELRFQAVFPAGWIGANEASRVVAAHPEGTARVELSLTGAADADEAAREFLAQDGLDAGSSRRTRSHGLTAVQADFSVADGGGAKVVGDAVFVELDGRVFRLLALARETAAAAARPAMQSFLAGFRRLTDADRIDVEPRRLRIERLRRPASLRELHRSWGTGTELETLAIVNGIDDPDRPLAAGTWIKRIEGRVVGAQRIGSPR